MYVSQAHEKVSGSIPLQGRACFWDVFGLGFGWAGWWLALWKIGQPVVCVLRVESKFGLVRVLSFRLDGLLPEGCAYIAFVLRQEQHKHKT